MRRPTGRFRIWRNGVLMCERDNLVVNAGLPAFAEQAAGGNGFQVAAVGYGSGSAAPTANDTDLTLAPKYYNAVQGSAFPSAGTVQFSFALQASDFAASGLNIQEIGLFANPAGAQLPAAIGFAFPAWAANSNQPVGNIVRDAVGHPFRSTTPPSWTASTAKAAGNLIIDSNGNLQQCTTAGTTGTSEPAFATAVGGKTNDGTVVWTCAALAGYTPTTGTAMPSFNISAIGALTFDNTVAWSCLAGLVVPQPMIAHATVPAFMFSGIANYSGTWALTF